MREQSTDFGRLVVGEKPALFARAVELAARACDQAAGAAFTWALTGGSTPQEWYRWCVAEGAIPAAVRETAHVTVSDERHVPLASDQSNYGNAERTLLDPLQWPREQRHPWPVELAPAEAAAAYGRTWAQLAGPDRAYDLCFLGMGDDAHTASIFPDSPLWADQSGALFAAVEVPGKGWRLSITPRGLEACGQVVVMALGANKAAALGRVMKGPRDPRSFPIQGLQACADRVTWLVDTAASAQL